MLSCLFRSKAVLNVMLWLKLLCILHSPLTLKFMTAFWYDWIWHNFMEKKGVRLHWQCRRAECSCNYVTQKYIMSVALDNEDWRMKIYWSAIQHLYLRLTWFDYVSDVCSLNTCWLSFAMVVSGEDENILEVNLVISLPKYLQDPSLMGLWGPTCLFYGFISFWWSRMLYYILPKNAESMRCRSCVK